MRSHLPFHPNNTSLSLSTLFLQNFQNFQPYFRGFGTVGRPRAEGVHIGSKSVWILLLGFEPCSLLCQWSLLPSSYNASYYIATPESTVRLYPDSHSTAQTRFSLWV
jgi:hypothetical protein